MKASMRLLSQLQAVTIGRRIGMRCVCVIALWFVVTARGRAQDFHPLAYAFAPVDNPLKGFVPYESATAASVFPCSLEWFYIPLAELMPATKTFDWAPLEKHLTAIVADGFHHLPLSEPTVASGHDQDA